MRLFFVVFLIFLSIFAEYSAYADDIFTIKNIEVAAEAIDAKEAKNKALSEGEAIAFNQLLKRITPNSTEHLWPTLDSAQISDLVQSMDIQEEKITAKHYLATIDISFNQNLTEILLQRSGLSYTSVTSLPTLLLPIIILDNRPVIWGAENIFSKAWASPLAKSSYANFVLPEGDSTDISLVNIEDIMQNRFFDMTNLNTLKAKYKCKDIIIVKAQPNSTGEKVSLDIELIQFAGDNQASTNNRTIFGETAADNISSLLENAASLIIEDSEKQWKNTQEDTRQAKQKITVNIPVTNLEEWNSLYKQITNFDFIEQVDLNYINVEFASLNMHFQNDYENLIKDLAAKGFVIEQTDAGLILKKHDLPPGLVENISDELNNYGTQYEHQR